MELKDKSTEKLIGELKGLKIVNGALIGVLSLLFIVCVFGLITKEDNSTFMALIAVPLALSASIPLNYGNMKKIKTELDLRK